jgi:multimeric flavodoxin WrbA
MDQQMKPSNASVQKVCETCKTIHSLPTNFCPDCAKELVPAQKTDEFLRKFLEIDANTLKRFKDIREATIQEAISSSKKNDVITAIGISGSARDQFDMAGEDSNSETLLDACMQKLNGLGAKTELLKLRKFNIKPCKACYSTTNTQCHFYCSCFPKGSPTGDDMSNILYDKILEADIIVFGTPVNNFKLSSLLSLFLDRCISLDGSLPPANPEATKDKELNCKHTKFIELMSDQNIPGSGFLRRFAGKVAGVIVTGHEEGASMVISQLFMTLNHFGMIFPPWSNMYAMSSIAYPTYKDKNIVTSSMYVDETHEIANNLMATAKLLRNFNKLNWQYDYSTN